MLTTRFDMPSGPVASRTRAMCRAPNDMGFVSHRTGTKFHTDGTMFPKFEAVHDIREYEKGSGIECELTFGPNTNTNTNSNSNNANTWVDVRAIWNNADHAKVYQFYMSKINLGVRHSLFKKIEDIAARPSPLSVLEATGGVVVPKNEVNIFGIPQPEKGERWFGMSRKQLDAEEKESRKAWKQLDRKWDEWIEEVRQAAWVEKKRKERKAAWREKRGEAVEKRKKREEKEKVGKKADA